MVRGRLIIILAATLLFSSCDNRTKEERDLGEVVRSLNEKCPAMLDSETRIDGIAMLPGNTLRYSYTLVNVRAQQVDTHEFRRAMWPGILGMIRVSREMKKLRDAGTVIEYYYADKESRPVYTFTVRPEHYQSEASE